MNEKLLTGVNCGNSSFHQKRLVFKSGESCSKHYHKQTFETYLVVEGEGKISVDKETQEVRQGDFIEIPPNTPHQIVNTGIFDLVIISTKSSCPEFIDFHLSE